jgi:hypothetical protein
MNESKNFKFDAYKKWLEFYFQDLSDYYEVMNIQEPFGTWILNIYYKYHQNKNTRQLSLFYQDDIPAIVGRRATPIRSESAPGRARTSIHGGRTTNSPPPKIQHGGILE